MISPVQSISARPRFSGPVFDAVDRVLRDKPIHRRFRTGNLSREQYAAFLDSTADELVAAGVPPSDVEFAKRSPSSPSGFVERTIADLQARGILDPAACDSHAMDEAAGAAARYRHGEFATYIYPEEGALLGELARLLKPRNAVFLGSYYGYWAQWAIPAIAARGGRATLVDPDPRTQAIARENFATSRFAHAVTIVVETGEPYLDATGETFDLVVLDAEGPRDHPDPEQRGKRVYYSLLKHALPRLAQEACLVCHNILLNDHSGAPFFDGVIARNRDELGPFLELVERAFAPLVEYRSTEGVGVARRRDGANT